jgi:tetratricopeptide (TPR) repeat protein
MNRIDQLKQFAEDEPDDPFNHYALALEYLKTDPTEAIRLFERLSESHPHYLPTYYPYAQLLIERKETEKAESIFQKGIGMARGSKEQKTLREILALYNDWRDGIE